MYVITILNHLLRTQYACDHNINSFIKNAIDTFLRLCFLSPSFCKQPEMPFNIVEEYAIPQLYD